MSELVSENMNGIRSELSELKNDIRKLPVKFYDIIRKEQKNGRKINNWVMCRCGRSWEPEANNP